MSNVGDKRRFNRFEFPKTVQAFPVLPSRSGNIYEVQPRALEARVHDISEGGLRLVTPMDFPKDSILKLHLEVKRNHKVVIFGKVVWLRRNYCGVSYLLLDQVVREGLTALARKKS